MVYLIHSRLCGNDNTQARQPTRASGKPCHPFTPRPAFLDSGLRWNDNGGRSGFVVIPTAPLLFPTNSLTSAPPSFRHRPESSGLHKPFPHSGNDNTQARQPTRASGKPCHPFTPRPAFLDSGLRWNDNGGRSGFVVIPTAPLLFPTNSLTSAPPSFRHRPESSGLHKPFPHSGNDNTQARQPNAPSGKPCHPLTSPARLPGFRPSPACCRQGS